MVSASIQPRFPGFLGRWKWLNEPVAAERVAALRIAAALALLLDLGLGCLPQFWGLFTDDGLAGSEAMRSSIEPLLLLAETLPFTFTA